MSIRRLRFIALFGSLLLVAASVAVTLWALRAQQDDAHVISLASRQRMYVQLIVLETLDIQMADNPVSRQTLRETADTVEHVLDALIVGGEVPDIDGTDFTLPPVPAHAADILTQLKIARATWGEMRPAIRTVLQDDKQSESFVGATATVQRLSPILLAQMDKAVRLYEAEAKRKVARVQTFQLGFLATAATLLVIATLITERQILGPIARLEVAAQRIGEGDLTTPVSVIGLREIDRLALSLDEMRRHLTTSAEVQTALLELSRRLLTATDERTVAECAVEVATSALHTDYGALVLPDTQGRLIALAVRGWPAEFAGRFELGRSDTSQTEYTILHGRPVVVEDYSTEMAFNIPPIVFEHSLVSGLSVPMFLKGRIVGAMLAHSRTHRRFGEAESRLLSQIANHVAVALEKARLSEAGRKQLEELTVLYAIASSGVETTNIEALVKHAVQLVGDTLHPDYFGIGLVDEAAGVVRICRSTRAVKEEVLTIPLGQGVAGQVLTTGQPRRIADVSREPAYTPVNPDIRSELCVPLVGAKPTPSGRVIGFINVEGTQPDAFSEADERLMMTFARLLTISIERACLFQAEQRGREAAAALLDITQVAGSSLELKSVLKHIAQRTAWACRTNRCTIFLLDETGQYLRPVMSQFADGHTDLEQWSKFKATTADRVEAVPLFYNAIRDHRPVLLDDAACTELVPVKWTQPFGIQKLLAVPLLNRDLAIGLMALDHAEANREFTAEQIELALTVGGQVTNAIANARLYSQTQQRLAELRLLHQASQALNADLSLEAVLKALADHLIAALDVQSCTISRWDTASNELVSLLDREPEAVAQVAVGSRFPLSDYPHYTPLLRHGQSQAFRRSNLGLDDPLGRWLDNYLWRSLLTVPLVSKAQAIGLIELGERRRERDFSAEQIQLAESLSSQAAIAIENARLFGELQQLAITDGLTGLYNRRHYLELAEREFQRARRYGHTLSVIILDIDHFKRVNDSYGHAAGDQVLQALARRCRNTLREIDLLGRSGGEEFAALLPESDLKSARLAAERLRRSVASKPVDTSQGSISITISLGLASLADDCPDLAALLGRADKAMYAAKAAGRNRVRRFAIQPDSSCERPPHRPTPKRRRFRSRQKPETSK